MTHQLYMLKANDINYTVMYVNTKHNKLARLNTELGSSNYILFSNKVQTLLLVNAIR